MNEERPYPENNSGDLPESPAHDATDSAVSPDPDVSAAHASSPDRDRDPGPDDSVPAARPDRAPADGTEAHPAPVPAPDADKDDEDEDQSPVWIPEPDKLLLSLLFASTEYLDARSLREIMGPEWDTPRLRQLVRKLNRDLEGGEYPFEIAETDGTFRLRTLPKYFPWTRRLFKEAAPRRLSQAALETLAIVAYKQPVTKAEIEAIRGVNVDGSMKTLLDKRLIDIGRRTDTLGQAFTYHTTREFMRYFGINRVPDDLPRLSEFEGILNAQSLIPQMGDDGEIQEITRPDEDGEQLTLGVGGVESAAPAPAADASDGDGAEAGEASGFGDDDFEDEDESEDGNDPSDEDEDLVDEDDEDSDDDEDDDESGEDDDLDDEDDQDSDDDDDDESDEGDLDVEDDDEDEDALEDDDDDESDEDDDLDDEDDEESDDEDDDALEDDEEEEEEEEDHEPVDDMDASGEDASRPRDAEADGAGRAG